MILAAAGLKRLGLESRINRYFTADEIIPAAGQGILAVQGRKGEAYDFLEGYCDKDAWTAGSAERAFVKLLDGLLRWLPMRKFSGRRSISEGFIIMKKTVPM